MNVLVVGPHPDDQELGMGGTIARLADQGHRVVLLDMTDGCPTPVGDRPTRLAEAAEAARVLSPERGGGGGVASGASGTSGTSGSRHAVRRFLLDLPNRRVEHTLHARHLVAGVIRALRADVIFLPHPEDAHPDHMAVTRIVEDARFDAKLTRLEIPAPPVPQPTGYVEWTALATETGALAGGVVAKDPSVLPPLYPKWLIYYYCSHLRSVPSPTFVFDTTAYAGRKRAAIEAYRTQFGMNPLNKAVPDRMASQDAYFGSRIATGAGEPFWMREPLGLSDLAGLCL